MARASGICGLKMGPAATRPVVHELIEFDINRIEAIDSLIAPGLQEGIQRPRSGVQPFRVTLIANCDSETRRVCANTREADSRTRSRVRICRSNGRPACSRSDTCHCRFRSTTRCMLAHELQHLIRPAPLMGSFGSGARGRRSGRGGASLRT